MDASCGSCGAVLRLNPNLAGTTVSCPQCGAEVSVPRAESARAVPPRRASAERPRPPRRFARPFTFWLLGAQAALAALGLSCLAGAFHRSWEIPEWAYVRENPLVLVIVGFALLLGVWAAYHLPVLTTLLAAVAALGACAWRYSSAGAVDLSRAAALAVAMLALWLALSHRRAAAGTRKAT